MTAVKFVHEPVMGDEAVSFLEPRRGGVFVDCTLGTGGHAELILRSSADSKLIGIDCDEQAVSASSERMKVYGERFRAVRGNFVDLDAILEREGLGPVEGILADLGVSSAQLEDADRGFSFAKDGPLDMRMDRGMEETAADIVGRLGPEELAGIFREFGEEPRARRIASRIVRERKKAPMDTTGKLARIVKSLYPARRRMHPATRVFQALRIAVNRELEALDGFLEKAAGLLSPGGRLCVISYHSLEDRIVKRKFASLGKSGGFRILTKKPLVPRADEVSMNRRARSAKMRALERTDEIC